MSLSHSETAKCLVNVSLSSRPSQQGRMQFHLLPWWTGSFGMKDCLQKLLETLPPPIAVGAFVLLSNEHVVWTLKQICLLVAFTWPQEGLHSATSQEKRWASLCLPFGKINIWLLLCILAAEWMDILIIQHEWWFWASKDPEEIAIQHLFGHDQWYLRDLQLLRFNVHDGSKYHWRLDVMVPVYWLHAMKTFTFLVGRG